MKAYKLTNQDNTTINNTLWGKNITHEANGLSHLCGPGWLHFYDDPYLAIVFNPIHARIDNPKLWLAKAEGIILKDNDVKFGCTKLTTIKSILVPKITLIQIVSFGILCAMKVTKDQEFILWANNWLDNKDRSIISASKTYNASRAAADIALADADTAFAGVTTAATAAYAAEAAKAAAYAAEAATAAYAAAVAAYAAATAATARAADVSANADVAARAAKDTAVAKLNFKSIIKQALIYK